MTHHDIAVGDTVDAANAFTAIDATIVEHHAGAAREVWFTIGGSGERLVRSEAEAWAREAKLDGCPLIRYVVRGLGDGIITVDLAAIEPLVREDDR